MDGSLHFGFRFKKKTKKKTGFVEEGFLWQVNSGGSSLLHTVVHPKALFCSFSSVSQTLLHSFTHVVYCKLFTHNMDGRHGDGSWMWWRESQVFLFGFSRVCVCMRVSRCFFFFGGKIPPLLRTSPTRPIYLFQPSSHPDTFTWAEESALPVSSNLPLLLKTPPSRFPTLLTPGAGRCFTRLLPLPAINRRLD